MPFEALNNKEEEKTEHSYIYSHTHTHTKTKQLALLNKRSQSALEYMMTYGWAILIIVIVAVILYSMGIFNPSSSISTTITGFSSTPVSSAIFTDNGGLSLSVQNSVGYPIEITNITATTTTGGKVTIQPNITLLPGKSQVLVLSKLFTAANQGSHISTAVTITYKEISQPLPGPYISTGSITGSTPTVIYPANYTFAAVSKLTIKNTQSSATPNPFQQMVNITSADNGWQLISNGNFGQNVEFFYSNGTIIHSWLESYTGSSAIWWLKLGSIPASSSITVYMGIAPTSTNLFNTVNDGEAPQIPCGSTPTSSCSNYAEYDDGVNVFNFYDNFAGTSLNTSKWSYNSCFKVFNGLSTNTSCAANLLTVSAIKFNNPMILDTRMKFTYTTSISGGLDGLQIFNYSNGAGTYFNGWYRYSGGFFSGGEWNTLQSWPRFPTQPIVNVSYVWSLEWQPSSYSARMFINYADSVSPSTYSSNAPVSIGFVNQQAASYFVNWIRVRAYPPNGVMPSVSFGSVA